MHQDHFKQPSPVVAILPRTQDYIKLCSDLFLPDLVVDDKYTLHPPSLPIMEDNEFLTTEAGMNVVHQKMQGSEKEHLLSSRVIIDNILLHSTSLSLCLLLLECYMRVYFKYRDSFRRSKCGFLAERFEFVGRNIMPTSNTNASTVTLLHII